MRFTIGQGNMIGDVTASRHYASATLQSSATGAMDRWMFAGVCGFLLAQAFTIPVISVGPWALWPTLSDLIFIGLFAMFVVARLGERIEANQRLERGLWVLTLLALFSFGLSMIRNAIGETDNLAGNSAISFGAYYLAKLIQFVVLFRIVASIPMSRDRLARLRTLTIFVLVVVCMTVLATYVGVVSTASLAPWLPLDEEAAGPWIHYRNGVLTGEGVGTVGYNHGYTALQITVLLGLALQLAPWSRSHPGILAVGNYFIIGLSAIGVFISGSRAGLLGLALFAVFYVLTRTRLERSLMIGLGLIGLFLADLVLLVLEGARLRVDIVDRQLGLLSPSSLATRTDIWNDILTHLNSNPIRWILGSGLGATAEVGNNAHMMPLQVVLDFGLIGLVVIGFMFMYLLGRLKRTTLTESVMFWLTVVLLVTSLTQETFYPVPAFGNLLGLYLVAVALTLTADRVAATEGTNQNPAAYHISREHADATQKHT